MVAIIDYGAGNLFGVSNALKQFTEEVYITSDKDTIRSADHVILPGVGHFDDAMGSIKKSGLIETVYEVIDQKKHPKRVCYPDLAFSPVKSINSLWNSAKKCLRLAGIG